MSVRIRVLFALVDLNVTNLLLSLDAASVLALWRTLVPGAVVVGLGSAWLVTHP